MSWGSPSEPVTFWWPSAWFAAPGRNHRYHRGDWTTAHRWPKGSQCCFGGRQGFDRQSNVAGKSIITDDCQISGPQVVQLPTINSPKENTGRWPSWHATKKKTARRRSLKERYLMLSMDDFPSLKPPFIIICWGFGIVMFYYPISPEGNSSFFENEHFFLWLCCV